MTRGPRLLLAGLLVAAACTRVGGPAAGPAPAEPPVDRPAFDGPPTSRTVDPGATRVAAIGCPAEPEREVLELMNRVRAARGRPPLGLDIRLQEAARAHARDLARAGLDAHRGSDGSQPGDRARRARYPWRSVAENVATGYPTPSEVVAGWMTSPGHRDNILRPGLRDAGVATVESPGSRWTTYWVVLFGTSDAPPRGAPASCGPGAGRGQEHGGFEAHPHEEGVFAEGR